MQIGVLRYLLSIAFLFVSLSDGLCCSCIYSGQTEREEALSKIKESATIFEAKILSDSRRLESLRRAESAQSQPRVFSMRVRKLYKGNVSGVVSVETSSDTCGADFEVGGSYLVFASLVDGKLFTHLCSGNVPIAFAGAELRVLRNEVPAPQDLLPPDVYSVFVRATNHAALCGTIEGADGFHVSGYKSVYVGLYVWSSEYGSWDESNSDAKYRPVSSGERYCYAVKPGKYLITVSSEAVNGVRMAGYYPGTMEIKKARLVTLRRGEIRQNFNLTVLPQRVGTVSVKLNVLGKHDVVSLGIEDLVDDPLHRMEHQSMWHPSGTNILLKDIPEGSHNFQGYVVDGSSGRRIDGPSVIMRTNGLSQDLTLSVP